MFERLSLVMVVVSDMDRSVAFYRDTLGIQLRFASPHWSEFDLSGVTLALHPQGPNLAVPSREGGKRNQGVSIGFYVPSLDACLAEITERGGVVAHRSAEDFGELAIVEDPDGYVVQICQIRH